MPPAWKFRIKAFIHSSALCRPLIPHAHSPLQPSLSHLYSSLPLHAQATVSVTHVPHRVHLACVYIGYPSHVLHFVPSDRPRTLQGKPRRCLGGDSLVVVYTAPAGNQPARAGNSGLQRGGKAEHIAGGGLSHLSCVLQGLVQGWSPTFLEEETLSLEQHRWHMWSMSCCLQVMVGRGGGRG